MCLNSRMPCSVSTSRSSNRTCGFPASGSPTGFTEGHTIINLRPAVKSLLERLGVSGFIRPRPISLPVVPSDDASEVRPLPSTGITRFRRYYGPLRHPTRPGLSLAGCRLTVTRRHRRGFSCCSTFPCANMPSPLPRWDRNPSRSVQGCDIGLPRPFVGSAPTSNVSRPARRSLALRPACSRSCPRQPFPSKASAASLPPLSLRLLPAAATRCRVGVTPTENVSLLTTHKGDKSNY